MTAIPYDLAATLAEVVDGTLHESYSGRGMYGDTCLGISVANADAVMFTLGLRGAAICAEHLSGHAAAEVLATLGRPSSDSLGRDTILYWPRLQVAPS